jgi:hypothetical protein
MVCDILRMLHESMFWPVGNQKFCRVGDFLLCLFFECLFRCVQLRDGMLFSQSMYLNFESFFVSRCFIARKSYSQCSQCHRPTREVHIVPPQPVNVIVQALSSSYSVALQTSLIFTRTAPILAQISLHARSFDPGTHAIDYGFHDRTTHFFVDVQHRHLSKHLLYQVFSTLANAIDRLSSFC